MFIEIFYIYSSADENNVHALLSKKEFNPQILLVISVVSGENVVFFDQNKFQCITDEIHMHEI